MGLFDTKLSTNNKYWLTVANDNEIDGELKFIIMKFLIIDGIQVEKYLENQRANDTIDSYMGLDIWEKMNNVSMDEDQTNVKINCTPTFRKYFSQSRLNRGLGIPDWFYIGYPDIAFWMHENLNSFSSEIEEREYEFTTDGKLNLHFYRYIIITVRKF